MQNQHGKIKLSSQECKKLGKYQTRYFMKTFSSSSPNVVSRPQVQGQGFFCDFIILLDSSHDSWENEVLFVNIWVRVLDLWLDNSFAKGFGCRVVGLVVGFWSYDLIHLLEPSGPNVVSRPQTPKLSNFLRYHDFSGFILWLWKKWGPVCENWSYGSWLKAWCIFCQRLWNCPNWPKLVLRP